jgi:hypothetical protein
MTENIIVNEIVNQVIVSSPGPQGARGKTILNGIGNPSNNLGIEGDFYYDRITTKFYGPKMSDESWNEAVSFSLSAGTLTYTWELSQVVGPVNNIYSVFINHNLGYNPNVTVKTSGGDVLETGITYNNNNQLTLTMAQPFSGTAHLS